MSVCAAVLLHPSRRSSSVCRSLRLLPRTAANDVRNSIGFLLQFAALVFLPLLIFWQLTFGFQLLWMPGMTIVGGLIFLVGHSMRDKPE